MKKLIIVLLFATAGATYAQKIDTLDVVYQNIFILPKEDYKESYLKRIAPNDSFHSMPGHMDSLDVYYERYLNDLDYQFKLLFNKYNLGHYWRSFSEVKEYKHTHIIKDYYDIMLASKYSEKQYLDSIVSLGKRSYEKIISKKESDKHRQMIVFVRDLIGQERTYIMLGQEATTGFENQIFFFERTKKYYDKFIKTKENPIEWKDDRIFKNKIFLVIGHNPHKNPSIRVIPLSELRKKNIAVIEGDDIPKRQTEILKLEYGDLNLIPGIFYEMVFWNWEVFAPNGDFVPVEDWRTIKGASTAEK